MTSRLLAKAKTRHGLGVHLGVGLFEIVDEPRPLTQEHAKSPLASIVLLIHEQVVGEPLDALGEECDLKGGGAGVIGASLELREGLVVKVRAGHLAPRHHLEALRTGRHRARSHAQRHRSTTNSTLEPWQRTETTRRGRREQGKTTSAEVTGARRRLTEERSYPRDGEKEKIMKTLPKPKHRDDNGEKGLALRPLQL